MFSFIHIYIYIYMCVCMYILKKGSIHMGKFYKDVPKAFVTLKWWDWRQGAHFSRVLTFYMCYFCDHKDQPLRVVGAPLTCV